ncbi:hypothetical protein ACFJIW_14820 [Tahibacter sp. UC22_41]|uniref:hypothetical protein n=1 Tax=Tahibacter sp. UC22_41 TaxID=3350178 RepID=UPI0036D7BABE
MTARLTQNPPPAITNVAGVTSSSPGTCAPAGTPLPCTAQAVVTVPAGGGAAVVPVPINNRWMLWLMALLLAGAAAVVRSRRPI